MLENGVCHVCSEAIMDVNAEHNAKKKVNEALLKDLNNAHEKIKRGEIVDQNLVNSLIIGRIMNIVVQKKCG